MLSREYNCGGYALGTFNWYRPYDTNFHYPGGLEFLVEQMGIKSATKYMTEYMLKQFKNLRQINYAFEVKKDEELILFRLGYNGFDADFHFIVQKGGTFLHKMGGMGIEAISKARVFNTQEWLGFYNGPIVFLAKKVD